jgi:diguanylate cyclase (GGDEF)-like protein
LPTCGCAISFFYFGVFLFYLGYFYGGITNLVFSLIYLGTFLFYLAHQVAIGKHFLSITFIIQVTLLSTYLFPKESYFQLYFLIAIPLVFILFGASEKKQRIGYSIIITLALTIIQFRTDTTIRPFNFLHTDITLIQNFNMVFSFLVLSVSAYLHVHLYEKTVTQTQKMAITDALTGVYNRRHFYDLGKWHFNLSQRTSTSFVLLYIDIDHFKQTNDQYGHKAGDDALKAVSSMIKNRTRESDVLARVGGDEFLLLLANTNIDSASKLAGEILQGIAIGYQANTGRSLSLSIGMAEFHKQDVDIDSVIKRADKALYQAKANGRNQLAIEPS